MDDESLPHGGVAPRKYAAIVMALGMARGALYSIEKENREEVRHILNVTSTVHIASALGYQESDLAIKCDEHLSYDEIVRINSSEVGEA